MTLRTFAFQLMAIAALLSFGACRVRSERLAEQGASKAARGDYKAAISDFDAALKLTSRNEEAYFFRGQARDRLGNHDAAIDDFTRYIELAPFRWDGYFRRGLAKAAKNDFAGAIADYDMAAQKLEAVGQNFESHDDRPKSQWVANIGESRRLAKARLKDATDSAAAPAQVKGGRRE